MPRTITLTPEGELRRQSAARLAYGRPFQPEPRLSDEADALRVAFENWPKGVNVSKASEVVIAKRLREGQFRNSSSHYIRFWKDRGWVD